MKKIRRIIAIMLSICLFASTLLGENGMISGQAATRDKTLKILAIGNSFSEDAQRWMYQIAEDAGYEDITIANLYWGGCSLWQHWDNAQKDYAGYEYQKNTTGEIKRTQKVSIKTAVEDEEWDFITLQQVSGYSGLADTYNSDLTNLVDYVKNHAKNPNMKLGWHMTWAYQSDSTHGDFGRYNNDQMTMYNAIVNAAKTKILTNKDFSFVIPAGTAIQNLRTSFIGDTLTRDGYHMSYNLGRYVVGLTWIYTVCQQMGLPMPTGVTYTPSQSEAPAAYLPAIHEAVGNAINKPLEVTKSSYTQVSDLFNSNNFTQLDWQPYCYGYWNSTDANAYDRITTDADISKNYIASSVRFTKDQIPVGSVITVANGYAYRPEGWVQLGQKNPNKRPDMVSSPMINVTDEWWGNYNYRGFNLYKSSGSISGTSADQARDILKIYVPKASGSLGASDVKSGSTYIMRSAMSQNYALMPKDSRPGWSNAVLYDYTGSNSQKWVVNQDGDNYNLKNVGTDLYLHYGESVKDAHVDQNGFDGKDFYKWKLNRINSGSYEGGYMVEAVKKADDGNPVYLTADNNNRETELYLRSENKNNQASQVWYFVETENVENAAITPDKVEEVSQAFLDKYYVDTKQSDGSTRKSLGGGFWVGAELLEMMLDAYQTTGDNKYRQVFESSYLDELDNIGNRFSYWTEMTETNWETNPYNDDIMWLTIASLRAYFMFGNGDTEFTNYLSNAKNNFDMVYKRGLKADGTIIWCQEPDKKEGTTSCINGPATIAACYLAKATGDMSYYEKAKNIHEAQRNMMFNASTGRVLDSPTNEWASTYNQGTWIGSCVLLYEYYQDQQYMDDAMKAMDFVLKQNGDFSDDYGILKSENATTGGDLPIFRSILMRYIRMMIVEFGSKADMTPYLEWMQKNARVAYNNQNIHGLIQTPFNKATPNVVVYKDGDNSPEITDVGYKAPGMSGAVGLMLNLPTFENTVIRNGFERIEAEKFDYVKGIMTETTSDVDGNRQVGGVKNDYYTAYSNVDFGDEEANAIELRVSTASAGSYVEVHLDKLDGELLGTVDLPHTNDWSVYATAKADIKPVSGKHTIYLVYKNDDNDYVCNINWLHFSSKQSEEPEEALQENQDYAIVSKNSEKAMTIEDYSSEDAAKLCQMTLSNYASQTWTLQDAGDGYYYIVNKFSGKVLNVSESSTEQGAIIEQTQKADVDSQKWKFEATDDDCYRITSKLAEDQALEVSEASVNDGAYIVQKNYTGADNQKWQLVAVEEVVGNPEVTEPDLSDPTTPSDPSTPSTPSVKNYTVRFDYSDGTAVISKIVKNGKKVQEPAEPLRNGYIFKGWYLEETEYDFETVITGDITLTAIWEISESDEELSEAKENLEKAIKKAESKKASDYTETTWKAYESALEKAESIQNNEESTLADLQDALVELENAERNLSEEDDATTNKPDDNGNTNNNNGNTNNNNGNTNNNNGNTNNNNGNTNNNNGNTNNNNGNTNNNNSNNNNTNNNNGNTNNNNGNTNNNNSNTNNNNSNTNNTNNNTTNNTNDNTDGANNNISDNTNGGVNNNVGNVITETPEAPITAVVDGTSTIAQVSQLITSKTTESDVNGSTYAKLSLRVSKTTNTSQKIKWNKVSGADGYVVFAAKCGSALEAVKTITSGKTTSWTNTNLNKGTYYKYVVLAYKQAGEKQIAVSTSKLIHVPTNGGKYTDVKSISVNKTKVTLAKGKTFTIKAKELKKSESKKVRRDRKISYESTNTKIATVSKSGKIQAKSKGKCDIYVYAQNGTYKKIKVTVK